MMKYPVLRFLPPHALVTVLFAIISLAYFYPLLSNKYLEQSDIVQYKGMQRQILEHRAEFDEEPYWIDNAFVGMPTYQITGRYPYDVLRYVDSALRFLPRPADMLFLYLFFFYLFIKPFLSFIRFFTIIINQIKICFFFINFRNIFFVSLAFQNPTIIEFTRN